MVKNYPTTKMSENIFIIKSKKRYHTNISIDNLGNGPNPILIKRINKHSFSQAHSAARCTDNLAGDFVYLPTN